MRRFLAKKNKETKMVKKKIYTGGFFSGYWKGKPVAMSARYNPSAKPEQHTIKEIDVPEDKLFPELIDPEVTPLSTIKEICEYNDIPFLWVTGINPSKPESTKLQNSDSVEKAIEHFIIFFSKGTTTYQYRKIFDDLIREKVINPVFSTMKCNKLVLYYSTNSSD